MNKNGFWEPWQPQVGQRVRTRACPECPDFKAGMPFGHSGVVDNTESLVALTSPGHRFHVTFSKPLPVWDGIPQTGGSYTAIELEPVEAL